MLWITDSEGRTRALGNNPQLGGLVRAWPKAEATIPRSAWPALIEARGQGPDDPCLPYVHDQDGIGQCNCEATTAIVEYLRARAGLPFVKLSPADLYDRINGGRDQGSLLEDALEEVRTNGVGTAETCGLLWDRSFRPAPPAERRRFLALEWSECPTFDHVMTRVVQGFAVNSGVPWFPNYLPDSDGWLPPGRGDWGGHAVMGYKPAMRDGRFGIWHQNSWGDEWGRFGGRCVFSEETYQGRVGGWFAIRVVVVEAGDVPAPVS